MRYAIIFLLILIESKLCAQLLVVDTLPNGSINRSYIQTKTIGDLPDSVYLAIAGGYCRIKVPKTIFQSGGGSAWGAITGTLSNQTDLNNALSGKAASSHSHAITDVTGYTGYSINVQALTSSPADGATIYFGMLPKAPVTTAAQSKVHIRKAGTIKIANIYCFSGTAGSNENWSVYVRINNTTDHLIQTLGASTSERIFTNSSLSIAVVAGDYIEIKCVNPTWATNPLTCIFGGYIYIE